MTVKVNKETVSVKENEMFILTVERCISAKTRPVGETLPEDWYVLAALAVPFEPTVGLEILMVKVNKIIKLTRVVWAADTAIFWAEVEEFLHPEPDAPTVASKLVDEDVWTVACTASDVVETRQRLATEVIEKLKSSIISGHLSPNLVRQLTMKRERRSHS